MIKNLRCKFGEKIILLCHEGVVIPEINVDKNGNINYENVYDLKPKIKLLINNKKY